VTAIAHELRNADSSRTRTDQLVTDGLMNKKVADKTGVGEISVKVHCANVMNKMGAQSLLRHSVRWPRADGTG
jgi:FixJ family two-component response regulator